jgi:hypothetical protein
MTAPTMLGYISHSSFDSLIFAPCLPDPDCKTSNNCPSGLATDLNFPEYVYRQPNDQDLSHNIHGPKKGPESSLKCHLQFRHHGVRLVSYLMKTSGAQYLPRIWNSTLERAGEKACD